MSSPLFLVLQTWLTYSTVDGHHPTVIYSIQGIYTHDEHAMNRIEELDKEPSNGRVCLHSEIRVLPLDSPTTGIGTPYEEWADAHSLLTRTNSSRSCSTLESVR